MALQSRRYHGNPLLQPNYDFRDVPYTSRDLSGSTISVVTERQHLVDSIAELTLLCNEATRRKKPNASSLPSAKKTTKPLSIEYIFDRIDTDDPLWGLMARTDTPMSFKGRASNLKSSPHWKRGMLQGFITTTTFTNWQSSFRFDSLHEMAFGQDEDNLEDQMRDGLRKYDEDGSLADELEASVKCGNPHVEGIVYPRIAEVALFGGLGCGKQLLRLLIEHLERLKATEKYNYDYIVLQATDNSIPFYESMGFTRVGCVQGKAPSPDEIISSPHFEYTTKKNGETPATIAKKFGADAWDVVFLNRGLYPALVQKSWLYKGTKIFVPKAQAKANKTTGGPKWYISEENETPRTIAKKFQVNFSELLQANKRRYPDLTGNSKLMEGTRIQVSRFEHDEGDMIAYSHWTFPDSVDQDESPSYMMALKLDRKKGTEAKMRPVEASLAVSTQPYCPKASGSKSLLLQTKVPNASAPLAPIFTKKPSVKEPKKPKRPPTSFLHFGSDARSEMAAELEGMSFIEVNKLLGEKWKALSDEEKAPYQQRAEESKAEYTEAMKKYEADMLQFQRESEASKVKPAAEVDTSLLEKVVKLKPNHGISGASKFEYYYVLTFIPDLQWAHLIPMRKVGVYGPEFPDAEGRPIWMIVGEDEGKEFDTSAAVCQAVFSLTMKNSADADDEQWNIYDNGEIPPPPRPAPIYSSKAGVGNVPDAPIRPKKPATSFAYFCGDAKDLMKAELGNKHISERTKIIAEKWKVMSDEEKQKYKDKHANAHEKYATALKQYKEDLAKYQHENPGVDISTLSSKTPKSAKKIKPPAEKQSLADNTDGQSSSAISTKAPKSSKKLNPPAVSTPCSSQKKKRGRPRKHPLPESNEADQDSITPTPKRKRGRPRKNPLAEDVLSTTKAVVRTIKKDPVLLEQLLGELKGGTDSGAESSASARKAGKDKADSMAGSGPPPGDNDVVLSLLKEKYRSVMWSHFKKLGKTQKGGCGENQVAKEVIETFMEQGCRFFKKSVRGSDVFEVSKAVATEKIRSDLIRRMDSAKMWLEDDNDSSSSVEKCPALSPTRSKKKRSLPQSPLTVDAKPLLSPTRSPRRKSTALSQEPKLTVDAKPLLSPTRSPRRKSTALSQEPKLSDSPSKYHSGEDDVHIPSQLAVGLPDGWVTRKVPRQNPGDSRIDTRWYSPELNLRFRTKQDAKSFAQKVKALGKGEAAAKEAKSPSKDVANAQKRPLAPIFLKKKKKEQTVSGGTNIDKSKEASTETPRYPERKRKQIIDANHVVSDDAISDTSMDLSEPRKKRRRTKC